MMHERTHPGEVLKAEFLGPLCISAEALAAASGLPVMLIADIIEEQEAITEDTALRLSKYFGNSARFWLGLQADHDVWITADSLIKYHGDGAEAHAIAHYQAMVDCRDREGMAMWKRIIDAVRELQAEEPGEGGVH